MNPLFYKNLVCIILVSLSMMNQQDYKYCVKITEEEGLNQAESLENVIDLLTLSDEDRHLLLLSRKNRYLLLLNNQERALLLEGYIEQRNFPSVLVHCVYSFIFEYSKYKGKKLPRDLSNYNLSKFDFTGCQFTRTKLHETNLQGSNLAHTICDYQQTADQNIPVTPDRVWSYYKFYEEKVLFILDRINSVYDSLDKIGHHAEKVTLAKVASGLAWLDFHQEDKAYAWYCHYVAKLYGLKIEGILRYEESDLSLEKMIECSETNSYYENKQYCWSTQYKRSSQNVKQATSLHNNFKAYLKQFESGFTQYNCKPMVKRRSKFFKQTKQYVCNQIKDLEFFYSLTEANKKKVLQVTQELATSYRYGGVNLYIHLNFCREQIREMEVKLKDIDNSVSNNKLFKSVK